MPGNIVIPSVLAALLAGCGHPAPAPAVASAPAAASPWTGWWEVDDVDDAGVLGGAALRLGSEPCYVVMPTIPAYEVCHATIAGSRLTVTGIGQDAAANLVADRISFDGGFGAHRASESRSTELANLIPAIKAKCDQARTCYRAAIAVLGIENREATDFGPLLRTDACANIVTNLVSDIQEAGKSVPDECAAH
jgi:hypothetical protein